MASLGFPWHVESISSAADLHIHEACDESKIIVTLSRKTCMLYDVEQREPLQTWSCKPREQLTCGAVYDPLVSQYGVIINSKAVRLWKFDELDTAEKTIFATKLRCLLGTSHVGIFVVFDNGHVEPLQDALRTSKEPREGFLSGDGERMLLCDVFEADEIQVRMLAKNERNNAHTFGIVVFNSSGIEQRRVRHVVDVSFDLVKTCSMLKSSSSLLLALASDGNSQILKLDDDGNLEKVKVTLPFWNGRQEHVAALGLHRDHVAVIQNTNDVVLWDLRYNVLKASREVKFSDPFKVWSAARCLFFTSDDGVHALPCSVEEPLLSSVVGSNVAVAANDDEDDPVVEADWLEDTIPFIVKRWNKNTVRRLPPNIRSAVQSMLLQGCSIDLIARHAFSSLLKQNDTRALEIALQVFGEAPEDIAVQLLDYFLSQIIGDAATDDVGISENDAFNINAILGFPFNDVQLLSSLQNLPLAKIKVLLEHLISCLNSLPHTCNGPLTNTKVVEWLCILLDSQFYALTLSKDEKTRRIIDELSTSVKHQLELIEELNKLESLTEKLALKPFSDDDKFMPYSVSILRIE